MFLRSSKSLKCRTKQDFEGFLESLGQKSLEAGKQDSQLLWPFAVPPPERKSDRDIQFQLVSWEHISVDFQALAASSG